MRISINGRIADMVKQTRFASADELETTLQHYLSTYNHRIPQRSLDHQTPIQALQTWHREKPDLFVRRVYKQAGLDSYRRSFDSRTAENSLILVPRNIDRLRKRTSAFVPASHTHCVAV